MGSAKRCLVKSRAEIEYSASGHDRIMIISQRALDRLRVSRFNGIYEQIGLSPPDTESVILHRIVATFSYPCDRVLGEPPSALRLLINVAVARNHFGNPTAIPLPIQADVPVDTVHNHPIQPRVHPEADDSFRLFAPFRAVQL